MTLKLRHVAPAVVLAPLLAFAACGRSPERAPAATPAASAVTTAVYECPDGRRITATYDRQSAELRIGDRTYRLTTAISASGARYVGDGVQWWTKGLDEGRLSRLKAGEDVATDVGVTCRGAAGGFTPVEPPAPGAAGGLPDDRTPISEAPFKPESPQGAADVVQTYYAHIGQRAYAGAWALWSDGGKASGYPTAEAFAKSFDRYAQYDAQIGGPGAPEGAAGSIYVTVPVAIYSRLKTGAEVHEKGEATLRRVNDVPGSTPEQRKWRIAKIETKPTP
ncbi:MliC family protein [Phenylobacterium sp.]|uniref:MliC family protein n=1 Tax=Phenylobacterium sp. TaxID=1871053 RepID=UPI0025E31C9A|nr:MliC family protein [Phenylobacterium sp.]MBX3485040.1 MliC family protein [Phenylobacterium sp.]MCW5758970.1 MliC family protein [Phenylobacterium sp.]